MGPVTVTGKARLIKERRVTLGLSLEAAARTSGISAESWRRYEAGAGIRRDKVAGVAKALKLRSLDDLRPNQAVLADYERAIIDNWSSSDRLTCRQALALATTIDHWADLYLGGWLEDSASSDRLDEIPPFGYFDKRIMMLVGENRAWVAKARERCRAVGDEIIRGVLPFDRPGCYFDEVLMAAALLEAPDMLSDEQGFFENIPAVERDGSGSDGDQDEEEYGPADSDWDSASDLFDDLAQWDDWEVPVRNNHLLLRTILENRHPFTWFDPEAIGESMHESTRRVVAQQIGVEDIDEVDREMVRRMNEAFRTACDNASVPPDGDHH